MRGNQNSRTSFDIKEKKKRRSEAYGRQRGDGVERSSGSKPSPPSCTPESGELIQQAKKEKRNGPLWRDCGRSALEGNPKKTEPLTV